MPHKPSKTAVSSAFQNYYLSLTILLLFTFYLVSCSNQKLATDAVSNLIWVGTWNTAPQLVEPHNMPPEPGLTNNTIRQVMRVSLGGDSIRIRFSNEFTQSQVKINAANIALSKGGSLIDSTTLTPLTFKGQTSVQMDSGVLVTSDPLLFPIKPRTDVAITIFFGETAPDVTGHPGSRTTSYILPGDASTNPSMTASIQTDHWYVVNGIDVKASDSAAAIAIIGNSITDGRGSGTNKQNRWPDILSERLLQNPSTQNIAVLNQGIGGNCVLKSCLGPAAVDRFERDVLNQSGVKWLIILEGVNDLGGTPSAEEADRVASGLITAYEQMIDMAHVKGIKVYGGTIMPIKDSFYYKDFRETARIKVNTWIRNSGRFDAVIDFDLAIRNPIDTLTLNPIGDTGDHLHPNEKGHQILGETVDLSLFVQ